MQSRSISTGVFDPEPLGPAMCFEGTGFAPPAADARAAPTTVESANNGRWRQRPTIGDGEPLSLEREATITDAANLDRWRERATIGREREQRSLEAATHDWRQRTSIAGESHATANVPGIDARSRGG